MGEAKRKKLKDLVYVPLTGWLRHQDPRGWLIRGPNWEQGYRGWQVFVDKPSEDAVPVTIVSGHR